MEDENKPQGMCPSPHFTPYLIQLFFYFTATQQPAKDTGAAAKSSQKPVLKVFNTFTMQKVSQK
jgi:hypothetical protein